MDEYINRDWLYDQMNAQESEFSLIDALGMIENFPAADVVPVTHGQWDRFVETGFFTKLKGYECSCCGFRASKDDYNYCPNCGAKMDGED